MNNTGENKGKCISRDGKTHWCWFFKHNPNVGETPADDCFVALNHEGAWLGSPVEFAKYFKIV